MLPALAPWILVLPVAAQGTSAPREDLEEGRFLKALADAEGQLKQAPNHALAWAAKAHALSALMRFPEAAQAAERALALDPKLADAYLARGLAKGGAAVQQRNFGSLRKATGALDDLQRATELDPTLATAWTSLGLAYQAMPGILGGSTRKALACAEHLRNLRPARAEALRGMILSLEGRWGEAEPCYQRALAGGAGDAQIVSGYLESLGSRETRKILGEAEQKKRLLQEARRLLPAVRTKARGVEAVADALLDAGAGEEAWKLAKDGLAQTETPSLLRLQLGKIADKARIHQEEGLAYLELTIREPLEGGSGGYAAAWWRKAQILTNLGRKREARAAVDTGLGQDPNHPGLKRLWGSLQQ